MCHIVIIVAYSMRDILVKDISLSSARMSWLLASFQWRGFFVTDLTKASSLMGAQATLDTARRLELLRRILGEISWAEISSASSLHNRKKKKNEGKIGKIHQKCTADKEMKINNSPVGKGS